MNSRRIAASLFAVLWALAGTASADIAFPARLDVTEREPGVYEISFTLPIIEGRKLRAQPRMPPGCIDASPRETGSSSGGFTSTWSVRCDPASLAGEAILIEGLLGGQTELAFTLTMLDGRAFSRILRPSRPGFLVPQPSSLTALSVQATAAGVRRTIRHFSLWFLLAVVAMLGQRPRSMVIAAGAFAGGHFLAQWLGGQGWLEVAPQTRDLLVWASIAVQAIKLAGGSDAWKDWLHPLWPAALLLGLLFGGAQPEAIPPEGLSNTEQVLALVLFAVGVGIAVLLMAAAARELRMVFEMIAGGRWQATAISTLGYVVGSLAVGMVLTQLVGILVAAGGGPRAPLEFVLLAAVLGPTLGSVGRIGLGTVPSFLALAVLGVTMGLLRVPLPLASLLALGSLLVLGVALAANRPLAVRWALAVAVIAVPPHAWSTALALAENVSRSTAATNGAVLVATCVFFASLATTRDLRGGDVTLPVRFLGAIVAVLAVGWRLVEYRAWFDREVATEAALGLARLPLLALGLVALAVMLWPRRRRVARELGMEQRSRGLYWFALGAAFLLLPYGTIAVPNPFFEPHAPRGDGARLIATRVLSDTYHAFNIADENVLYDTLADSVTGDLVDDLFLDSRRRLTAGTREGTQVTVRDVSVLEIGEPLGSLSGEESFSYDCRWAVVARVQHLQHVHHRQNIYNGVLTLRPDGGRWKIAGVELYSEDRVVVPWSPT